jgi:ABC-type amino acid transport substrate-binding protein
MSRARRLCRQDVREVQPDSRVAASKGQQRRRDSHEQSTALADAIDAGIATLLRSGKIADILKANGIDASPAGASS